MQKILSTILAAAVVFAFTWQTPTDAQAGKPDGDDLAQKAESIRDAWLNGTPEEFFKNLAPWIQGRVNLFREKLNAAIDKKLDDVPMEEKGGWEEEWVDEIVSGVTRADPEGTLNVKQLADVKNLTAAQLLVIGTEQLQLQADTDRVEQRKANWHEVDRVIYEAEGTHAWREGITQTFGDIAFMNRFDDLFVVSCVWDGSEWQVIKVGGDVEGWDFGIGDWGVGGEEPMTGNPLVAYREREMRDARRSEGEQLLGTIKGHARVAYAKTGSAPKTLLDADVEADYREGKYFKIRDEIYKKPDKERGALVAEPLEHDDGWGVLYFNYAGGDGELKWYNTRKSLDEALEAFETAK